MEELINVIIPNISLLIENIIYGAIIYSVFLFCSYRDMKAIGSSKFLLYSVVLTFIFNQTIGVGSPDVIYKLIASLIIGYLLGFVYKTKYFEQLLHFMEIRRTTGNDFFLGIVTANHDTFVLIQRKDDAFSIWGKIEQIENFDESKEVNNRFFTISDYQYIDESGNITYIAPSEYKMLINLAECNRFVVCNIDCVSE